MRLLTAAVCTSVAAALLASCSGGSSPSSAVMPGGSGATAQGHHHAIALSNLPKSIINAHRDGRLHGKKAPGSAVKGSWASGFFGFDVYGYPKNNSGNGPPTCTLSDSGSVNGFGVDTAGDVIIPQAFSGIAIYGAGCGSLIDTIPWSSNQTADAAAINAQTGNIVVGGYGWVGVCTMASNNCTTITPSNGTHYWFYSVAMDSSGTCYAYGFDNSSVGSLWYYPNCSGSGIQASGFSEPGTLYNGGVDVDNKGNLVVINQVDSDSDFADANATVYSGCGTGTCSVVAGPTFLSPTGSAVDEDYCRLGRQNERLICGDGSYGQVDVFTYLPSREPSYLYSFNNSISSLAVEAAAYSPSSQSK
jgi:hypothetical protein